MSDFKDHFSNGSDSYRKYRPRYPESLYKWLHTKVTHPAVVWECGAGSGQATEHLARHFHEVIATEPSAKQLEQAPTLSNVRYEVSAAETFEAPAPVDMVVVAQAIHWFNHPQFFANVDKQLKDGGVLVVWGYQLMEVNDELDPLLKEFHDQFVGPFWPQERQLLNNGYSEIQFPYKALETPEFCMSAEWSFNHLLGYLNTWSATRAFEDAKGENPVNLWKEKLGEAWGNKDKQKVSWPLILYVGQK